MIKTFKHKTEKYLSNKGYMGYYGNKIWEKHPNKTNPFGVGCFSRNRETGNLW